MSGRGRAPTVLSSLGRGRGRGRAVPAPRRPGTAERMQEHAPGPPLHVQPSPLLQGQHHQEGRAAMVSAGMNQTEEPDDDTSMGYMLTLSGVPDGTTEEELVYSFEYRYDSTDVRSTELLGNGKARVQVSGLSKEDLSNLQQTGHKVRKKSVTVELQVPHTAIPAPDITTIKEPVDSSCNFATVLVSGVPESVEQGYLELLFQNPKSGGCEDSLVDCEMLPPGRALVTFRDPGVAAQVISKSGSLFLKGSYLQVCNASDVFELNKLLLQMSKQMDQSYLELYLESVLKMSQTVEFSVESTTGLSAVIMFTEEHTVHELVDIKKRIHSKHLKDITIVAKLCQKFSSSDLQSQEEITLQLSGLSPGSAKDVIEHYFESQGAKVEVVSAAVLGSGKATVTLSGLTDEEIQWMKKRKHRIDKQLITITFCASPVSTDFKHPQDSASYSQILTATQAQAIIVSGVPEGTNEAILQEYFEGFRGGGYGGCVEECTLLSPSKARIRFHSSKAVQDVLSKAGTHDFKGSKMRIQIADESGSEEFELDKLLLLNIPMDKTKEFLIMFLENQLRMCEGDGFSIAVKDSSALLKFPKEYSLKELTVMADKLKAASQTKLPSLVAEVLRVTHTVRVCGITDNYDPTFLREYFTNQMRSGGGEVESVELLGDGVAVITFKEYKAIPGVLEKVHESVLGNGVSVVKEEQSELLLLGSTPNPSTMHATCIITVDPLIAQSIINSVKELEARVRALHVTIRIDDTAGTIEAVPTTLTKAKWEQECSKALWEHIQTKYTREERDFPQEASNEITNLTHATSKQAQLAIAVSLSSNTSHLSAAGEIEAVNGFVQQVDTICSRYVQATEEEVLTPLQYRYFVEMKLSLVRATYPHVVIEPDTSTHTIAIQGSIHNVAQVKEALRPHINPRALNVQLKPLVIRYLQADIGKRVLREFMKKQQCQAVVHFEHNDQSLVLLCDPSQESFTKKFAELLLQKTNVETLPLQESFVCQLPDLTDYSDVRDELQKQHHVLIVSSDRNISIAGFSDEVLTSLTALQGYIQAKCTTKTNLEIDGPVWRLLSDVMADQWKGVMVQAKKCGVTIIPSADHALKCQVKLVGDMLKVEEVCQSITRLLKSVCKRTLPFSRPGMYRFFKEHELFVKGIETKHRVVIETKEIDDSPEEESQGMATSLTRTCAARTHQLDISLYVGDITELDRAEVIVNAANRDLCHIGGVARAIADKGGPEIQNESSHHVRRNGPLQDGGIWLSTKVGNLPFKAIIHAVGPKWRNGYENEEALLYQACYKSLEKAGSKGFWSIALPAIGSGAFGFPTDRCAQTLIKAAIEYSRMNPRSSLQEVNFVLHTNADSDVFIAAVKEQLPTAATFTDTLAAATTNVHTPTPTPVVSEAMPSPGTPVKKKPVIETAIQAPIRLHRGSILDIEADVYVNTTNGSLDLSQGAVAVALAKAAGPQLQSECNKKGPVAAGDIAVTSAGRLSCRHVFHAVVPTFDKHGGQAEEALKSIIRKCMTEAMRIEATSIAFPAIGTGALRFPNDVVASIMVDEISEFWKSHGDSYTSLEAVHLVIYMEQTHAAFERQLASVPTVEDEDLLEEQTPSVFQQTASAVQDEAHFGSILVQVVQGDISEEQTDVVVNTTNRTIDLQVTAVSKALLRKGGTDLQSECHQVIKKGPLKQGEVAMTPSRGKLKSKAVFHVCLQSESPQKFVKLIKNCLQKADKHHYQSIAFPAIGTGMHGFPPHEAAQGIFQAITKFSKSKKHTQLACVRLVLFQPDIHQAFVTVLQESITSSPGLISRVGGYIGSFFPWSTSSSTPDDDTSDDESELVVEPAECTMLANKALEVTIYGATDSSVVAADETLMKTIDDHLVTENMNLPNLQVLSRRQMYDLKRLSQQKQVVMDVNPHPFNYIVLRGNKQDVAEIRDAVNQAHRMAETEASKKRESEELHRTVKWQHQDLGERWVDYDPLPNLEIEHAYRAIHSKYEYKAGSEHFEIDLTAKMETDFTTAPPSYHKVRRIDLLKEGYSTASHWDSMPVDVTTRRKNPMLVVDLKQHQEEYKQVLKKFNDTMQQGQDYTDIASIQRIQTPVLYAQYSARKMELDKQNPQGHQNERQLFHGTSADSTPKINLQGFNRSFSGKNATLYGHGVYFARDAEYSARDTYSPKESTTGYKYVYLARVLTGVFTTGDSSMIIPPARDGQDDPNFLYDSVVDDTSSPGIFVVFNDAQAYPEYLITFK